MPVNTKNQIVLSAIVSREKGEAFKKLAKKHYRSISAELTRLIDKALEEEREKPKS